MKCSSILRLNVAGFARRALRFVLMLPFLFYLTGCGGAKKTAQTDMQPASVHSDDEPALAATAPSAESRSVEKESFSPAAIDLQNIYFDFDRYNLRSEALEILAEHARTLQAYPGVGIILEGHCDERGTVEYNLALGDKRAQAAKDYLVALGVNPARISTISYGKEKPSDYRHTEEAWARNRRAEFKIKARSDT